MATGGDKEGKCGQRDGFVVLSQCLFFIYLRVASSRGDSNTSDTCTIDSSVVRYITIEQLHKEVRARIAYALENPPWGPGGGYPFGGWGLGGALNVQKKPGRSPNLMFLNLRIGRIL